MIDWERMLEPESYIVGALCIGGRKVYTEICGDVYPEYFHCDMYRAAYESAGEIIAAGHDIDPVQIVEKLKARGFEEAEARRAIGECMDTTPTAAHVSAYVKLLISSYRARSVREIAQVALETLCPEGVDEQIQNMAGALSALTSGGRRSRTFQQAADNWYEQFYSARRERVLRTGFSALDKILDGIYPSDFVVVAARPGVGKSAFANAIAIQAAKERRKVLFVSLEMSEGQILDRMYAAEANIPLGHIRARNPVMANTAYAESLKAARGVLCELDGSIDDNGLRTVPAIVGEAVATGAELVIVDYLQLMEGRGDFRANRNNELAQVSRDLRQFALKSGVPVIALAQLNREGRDRPQLHHLRDCGAIEQDTTTVIMLWKHAEDEDGKTVEVVADVQKNRQGPLDSTILRFHKPTMRFEDTGQRFVEAQTNTPPRRRYGGIADD